MVTKFKTRDKEIKHRGGQCQRSKVRNIPGGKLGKDEKIKDKWRGHRKNVDEKVWHI